MNDYPSELPNLQRSLRETFGRDAPLELDSLCDVNRLLYPLWALEPTWREFADDRSLLRDASAFVMGVLGNLWSRAGFAVRITPHSIPSRYAVFLPFGLKADTAICAECIPATSGLEQLTYAQFVPLDLFRLVYEAPNPLPMFVDYSYPVRPSEACPLLLYAFGVTLLNHPWTLSEKARQPLADTAYPWQKMVDIIAESHLRYFLSVTVAERERGETWDQPMLLEVFRSLPLHFLGHAVGKPTPAPAVRIVEIYFEQDAPAREQLRRCLRHLIHSANPHLQVAAQASLFALAGEDEQETFVRSIHNGTIVLSPEFGGALAEIAPVLKKHGLSPPNLNKLVTQ